MRRKKTSLAISFALGLTQLPANAQFYPVLELSNLDGSNGFTLNGGTINEVSGQSVSSAGDINGDGIEDLIIGAPGLGFGEYSMVGNSYVVFGSINNFPNPINLSTLDGTNGFVISGASDSASSGSSVSAAGDINGDGIDDVIIGASLSSSGGNTYAGSSYVVFGTNSGFDSTLDLSNIDGTNGFVINGEAAFDFSGSSVSSAGDINGDGIDDLIIGASQASPGGSSYAGSSYVLFGSNNGISNPVNLSSLDGNNGFSINGLSDGDSLGRSVSGAGDINNDGIDDLIIGATNASSGANDYAGSSYVIFGSNNGYTATLDLSTLDGTNGFIINGAAGYDFSGRSVSDAGDVNGDGIDDLIIGANRASPNGENRAGSSYVIFGSDSSFPNPFNLSGLDGTNGISINGVNEDDYSGRSVSAAGDVNGDGIGDVIIGAYRANLFAGNSYVVFGSKNGLPNPLNLSSLDGSNGFAINGTAPGDTSGASVSAIGDFNGDGVDDVIIGASNADPAGYKRAGSSYVVFGSDVIFTDGFE